MKTIAKQFFIDTLNFLLEFTHKILVGTVDGL
jgi:hypothetical protein